MPRKIILILILTALLLRIPVLLVTRFNTDEFGFLHSARSIYHGMAPYHDYFEPHMPLLQFLFAPLYFFTGDSIAALFMGRGGIFVFTCLILYLTYYLARLLYGSGAALYAAFALSYMTVFLDKGTQVRPDIPAIIFLLLALIFFIRGVRNKEYHLKRPWYFFLTGIMISAAILFTLKAVFAAIGLLMALLWGVFDRRVTSSFKEGAAAFLCFGLGALIPAGALCLYLFLNGAMGDFLYRNILLNLFWKADPSVCYDNIKFALHQNSFFCILGLTGLIAAVLQLRMRENILNGSFAPIFLTCALVAGLFFLPLAYFPYFLLFIPLLAVYCGFAIDMLGRLKEGHRYGGLIAAGFAASVIVFGYNIGHSNFFRSVLVKINNIYICPAVFLALFSLWLVIKKKRYLFIALALIGVMAFSMKAIFLQLNRTNSAQLNEIRFILQNTTPEDTVFDAWTGTGVFRDHAYYYYYLFEQLPPLLTKKELSEDIVNTLREKKTKIVIYDRVMKTLSGEVNDYIENNYIPTGVGDIYILKRQAG